MPHLRILLLLLATLTAASADAAIYKYVDENGRVTFTDVYRKGAKRMDLQDGGGSPPSTPPSGGKAARTPSPADFPRIDGATQKRRDDIRRQVLQDEIASEKREAASAKQQLALGLRLMPGERASSPGYIDRVKKLREEVARHEQNVAAIQRELNNLR